MMKMVMKMGRDVMVMIVMVIVMMIGGSIRLDFAEQE